MLNVECYVSETFHDELVSVFPLTVVVVVDVVVAAAGSAIVSSAAIEAPTAAETLA